MPQRILKHAKYIVAGRRKFFLKGAALAKYEVKYIPLR